MLVMLVTLLLLVGESSSQPLGRRGAALKIVPLLVCRIGADQNLPRTPNIVAISRSPTHGAAGIIKSPRPSYDVFNNDI